MADHLMNAVGDEPAAIQDAKLILDNPGKWFSKERVMVARPPVDIAFMAGYLLWGENPAGYHFFQIGLHLVAAWMVFYTLRQFQVDILLSMMTSVLFLTNVAHFRTVQWVICINYILACIFALATVIWYNRYLTLHRTRSLYIAMGFLLCAIFSHPASVAVALFCAYLTWYHKHALRPAVIIVLASFIFTGLAYLASPDHPQAQGGIAELEFRRLLINPIWYIGRLIISAHWLPIIALEQQPGTLECILGALFIGATALLLKNRIAPLDHWATWTILMVLPFINNAPDRQIIGPSRQLYFASIGSSFILAWGIYTLGHKIHQQRLRTAFIFSSTAIIVAISAIHLQRAEAIDYWFVGRSYAASNQFDIGLDQFQKAENSGAQLLPSEFYRHYLVLAFSNDPVSESLLQKANKYHRNDLHVKALLHLPDLLSHNPEQRQRGTLQIQSLLQSTHNPLSIKADLATASNNAASFFYLSHQYEKAIDLYNITLEFHPNYALAHYNQGNAYNALHQFQDAQESYVKALQNNPDLASHLYTQAIKLFEEGEMDQAISLYKSILDFDPTVGIVYYHLGLARKGQGNFAEAAEAFQKGADLLPDDINVLIQQAEVLTILQEYAKAISVYRRIIPLRPDDAAAHCNLGILLLQQGHHAEAKLSLEQATSLAPDDEEIQQALRVAHDTFKQP